MKSNPFKRVLSFMLVLSMVLGLMPGISYEAAQAASTPLVYSFSRNTNTAAGDTDYANASGYVAMDQITEYGKNGSRKWKYLASKGFSSSTTSNFGYGTGYSHWVGAETSDTWVAFEIYGIPSGVVSGGQYDKLMQKLNKKSRAVGFAVYLGELDKLPEEEAK